jgi:hypothetical protein
MGARVSVREVSVFACVSPNAMSASDRDPSFDVGANNKENSGRTGFKGQGKIDRGPLAHRNVIDRADGWYRVALLQTATSSPLLYAGPIPRLKGKRSNSYRAGSPASPSIERMTAPLSPVMGMFQLGRCRRISVWVWNLAVGKEISVHQIWSKSIGQSATRKDSHVCNGLTRQLGINRQSISAVCPQMLSHTVVSYLELRRLLGSDDDALMA